MDINQLKVYIDPGHGAGDSGACANGVVEHNVNVIVGNEVAVQLRELGATVKVRDVSDPKFLDLPGCLKIAQDSKNWGANIFLSIHCNSTGDSSANGTETYTQRGTKASTYEKKLADRIQNGVRQALGTANRGVKETDFNVFDNQTAWCVLTELAFVSNVNDANLLKNSSKLRAVSDNITSAIFDFVQNELRGY